MSFFMNGKDYLKANSTLLSYFYGGVFRREAAVRSAMVLAVLSLCALSKHLEMYVLSIHSLVCFFLTCFN